jgi:uncharacterized protein YdaU (DUF1376 family)
MSKRPSFQFYPQDWLGSPSVAAMSAEEEGAYIRLLCYCWNSADCALPDNPETLARLSRVVEGYFKGSSSLLRNCFIPHPEKEGYITHPRLLEERKKQDEWREKCKQGGKKSAQARNTMASKGLKGSSALVATKRQLKGNTSSSTSSSSSLLDIKNISNKTPYIPLSGEDKKFDPTWFNLFWEAYPKKQGDKKKALGAWKKNKLDLKAPEIIADVNRRKTDHAQWQDKQFIPYPTTYLNGERWNDEIEHLQTQTQGNVNGRPKTATQIRGEYWDQQWKKIIDRRTNGNPNCDVSAEIQRMFSNSTDNRSGNPALDDPIERYSRGDN